MNKIKRVIVSLCILLVIFTSFHPVLAVESDHTNIPIPNVQKSQPLLQILSTETYRVFSQKENVIRFSLNNTSRFTANSVQVRPNINADKSVPGVRILSTVLEPNNRNIGPEAAGQYELRLVVDGSAKEGIYPISLDISYKNNAGDPFKVTALLYYEVRKDESKLDQISIIDENFGEVKPEADKELVLKYRIKNEENYQLLNLKTKIEGLPAEFTLKSISENIQLGNLMPLIAKEAVFEYYVKSDVKAGNYPFNVIYEYDNSQGQRIVRQEAYNLFVSPDDSEKSGGILKYSGFSYPNSVGQDQSFQVSFQISNPGEKDVKDVSVKMADNPVFLPKTASVVKYDEIKPGQSQRFVVTLVGTGDGLKDRNYPISFEISYKTSKAKDAQASLDTQVIGVYLDAKDSEDDKNKEKNLPKIILDSYKIEPTIVQAGQEFDLDMVFRNTNQSKEIYNVKAFLTFDVATGKETVNQNVFSPVNSSNTFYIDRIGANGTVNKHLKMYVVPDAEPKTYTVTVNFEYEDKDGKQISSKELVGIPVMQITKVETSDLSLPTSVMQNQEIPANFNLFNTGKAKAYNVIINAEGNFKADPNNQYIGNFDAGQNNSYEGYISFSEPGEQRGKFVISYDDQSGQTYTIEKEFTILVEEPMSMEPFPGDEGMMPDGMGEDMGQGGQIPWLLIIGGILLVLVIGGIILGIMRKRKHKKEMSSYEEK